MASWHGRIFESLSAFVSNIRFFSYYNRSFMEFIFIMVYALEQLALILITYLIEDLHALSLIVSVFALVVLTTFAVHKLIMESRIKILEEDVKSMSNEKISIEEKARDIYEKYNELLQRTQTFKYQNLRIRGK